MDLGTVDGEELTLELDEWGEVSGGEMGDDAVNRGIATLERAKRLHDAGNKEDAVLGYKEVVACFEEALRGRSVAPTLRATLRGEIEHYRKLISAIENEIMTDMFGELMPEAPSTVPSVWSQGSRQSQGARGRRASPEEAKQAEDKARNLLLKAIEMDERGKRAGWTSPGIKVRVSEAYTAAAEAFMAATRVASDGERAKALERLGLDAVSRVEDLKPNSSPPSAAPRPRPSLSPSPALVQQPRRNPQPPRSPTRPSEGGLTDEEVEVLKASSFVNRKLFLPWVDVDLQETFKFSEPWSDPDGLLSLSEPQRAKLQGWRRPSEFIKGKPQMIANVNPYSIRQDLITDCSFVASLCIASAFERRFHKQLITGIIYPQDARRVPVYNPDGKYLVKLFINGVGRKVVVDDRLPTGEKGRLLCSSSTDKTELWVSIIEKAYLKVNGGYDFPGSNSGIDLYALTGWLPEQIFFEEHRESKSRQSRGPQPLDNYEKAGRVWERLLSAHEFGDCLITVATSDIAEAEAEKLGLVPSHAYAVLDVKEVSGTRLLQVKNPWSRKRWRGPYSVEDSQRWTPALKQAVKYDVGSAQLRDNGVFWIDFASIFQYFRNVFMNWNPGLFRFRSVLHARWPANLGPKNDTYNLGKNPQYTLKIQNGAARAAASGGQGRGGSQTAAAAGGAAAATAASKTPTVWVLLSRHVTQLESDADTGDFLTMHVYKDTQGRRVYYPDNPMFRGIYTNNPHTLIRFDVPLSSAPEVAYTMVVSQYEKKREVRYTVNVYCTAAFKFHATPVMARHRRQITAIWDEKSAGGAVGKPTFYMNPQYSLALAQDTAVHLQLEAPKDYQVNISVISEGGSRVDIFTREREAMTTGSYRPGFCYVEGFLSAGTYTIVVSTYKPGQIGGFVLTLASSHPVRPLSRIPGEGEGMSKQVIRGRWKEDDGSAAGCSNFERYLDNPRYRLSITSSTRLLMRVAIPDNAGPFPSGRPALNVSLFRAGSEAGGEEAMGSPAPNVPGDTSVLNPRWKPTSSLAVASSNKGVYLDSSGGCVTDAVEIAAGDYVAIVSSYSPQEADYVLTVYSGPETAKVQRMA